jgi:hypothetical protein
MSAPAPASSIKHIDAGESTAQLLRHASCLYMCWCAWCACSCCCAVHAIAVQRLGASLDSCHGLQGHSRVNEKLQMILQFILEIRCPGSNC